MRFATILNMKNEKKKNNDHFDNICVNENLTSHHFTNKIRVEGISITSDE